ncbi:MAG: protein translocase subunit SecD [Bacteroidia bacterium]
MAKQKSFIVTLLVIFGLICTYNLFWAFERLRLESNLNTMSATERESWLKDAENYDHYKKAVQNSFALGLDLQGGMYITLEVGVADLIRGLSELPNDSIFVGALTAAQEKYQRRGGNLWEIFLEELKTRDPNAKLAVYFAGPKTGLPYNASDDEVKAKVTQEIEDAIERTYKILRVRIDQFGVTSPNLQRQPGSGRILIELPGVKDSERVRRLLRTTARLEFWPTYTVEEVFPLLQKANDRLKVLKGIVSDTTKRDTLSAQADTSALAKQFQKPDSLLSQEERQKKFDAENPLFAVLRFPDFKNTPATSPVMGYALISDTAQVNAYLRNPEVKTFFPDNLRFAWVARPEGSSQYLSLIGLRVTPTGVATLTGDRIVEARQDFNPDDGTPMVTMQMDAEGARIWRKMTTDYLGKSIAVTLDGLVYTYPTVQSVIPNGNSQITGNFTIEEAKDLANVLKAGKLPAQVRIESEEIIGPTLGQASVRAGITALLGAFVAIIAFMAFYYGSAGMIANLALILNLFFLLGLMAALNVVLTLPGIAGIVLTLGMAVDANVLIYERVREELRQGKSLKGSVEAGFSNALSAIIDANLTTFLAGAVLFLFGVGPIRGFAVTLMIGILTTLITGIFVTRYLVDYFLEKGKVTFASRWTQNLFVQELRIDFIGKRLKALYTVGALSLLMVIVIVTLGFRLGLDFTGGYQFQVSFQQAVDVDKLRQGLRAAYEGREVVVRTVGVGNDILISTSYLYDQPYKQELVIEKLRTTLEKDFSAAKPQVVRSALVGPSLAEDIRQSAWLATIFTVMGIGLYILLRFRNWGYVLGAVSSLVFNALFSVGIISLFGKLDILPFAVEANQDLIAAILTILGYTINDGVVLFDRVREEIRKDKGLRPLYEILNLSMNRVILRTIITTFTAVLTVIFLLFFGGDSTRAFAFVISMGFLVGILSTLFVAAPVAYLYMSKRYEAVKQGT